MKFFAIAFLFLFFINAQGQELPTFKVINSYYELYAHSEDSLKAAQKEMEYCIGEFRKYFHQQIAPIAIIISDSVHSDNTDSLKLLPRKMGITSHTYYVLDAITIKGVNIVAHEAAHGFLIAYAKENWNFKSGDYTLWSDEAIAILCEHPDLKKDRRVTMRDSIEKRVPLSEIFAKWKVTGLFYNELLSIMEFIIEKEGNEIVEKIVEESIRKKTMEEILKQHAKNIPSDLKELEKVWVEWVKKN